MYKNNTKIVKDEVILKLQNIHKYFGTVQALKGVNLQAISGKCMAVIGENGAGKSTLMNIISGYHEKTSGSIWYKNRLFDPKNIKFAESKGISIIHQELSTISQMTVIDNIFLGSEILSAFGNINYKKELDIFKNIKVKMKLDFNPYDKIVNLTVAQQQMLEIAKAVIKNAKVIIMDEPTSSLSDKETIVLFDVIKKLKKEGKAIIYISHRLQEIPEICEFITIIRDGQTVGEFSINEIDENKIIEYMVGREITERFPPKKQIDDKRIILKVDQLQNEYVKNISFSVTTNEVLGFAGLIGAGRTELFKSIIGLYKSEIYNIYLNDENIKFRQPSSAIKHGVYYVTEDRKDEGLFLEFTIKFNLTISSLKKLKNKFANSISKVKEKTTSESTFKQIRIKAPNDLSKISELSGGNQQKVLVGKALIAKPKIIIFDEPTRGVDVGARRDIYDIIHNLKNQGNVAIVVISSDLQEIVGLCDRVLVMKQGQIMKEIRNDEITQENIIRYAL